MKEVKYHIDPHNTEADATICGTIRQIWRAADTSQRNDIRDLAETAFDQASRMSASIKKYRRRMATLPPKLQGELDKIC